MKTAKNRLKKYKKKKDLMCPIKLNKLKLDLKEKRKIYTEICVKVKFEDTKKFISEMDNVGDAARVKKCRRKLTSKSEP